MIKFEPQKWACPSTCARRVAMLTFLLIEKYGHGQEVAEIWVKELTTRPAGFFALSVQASGPKRFPNKFSYELGGMYQNQAVFHLSQVVSAITPRRPGLPTICFESKKSSQKKAANRAESSALKGVICPDSFLEAVKNFSESQSKVLTLDANLCSSLLKSNIITLSPKRTLKPTQWNLSYVSSGSFNTDKANAYPQKQHLLAFKFKPFIYDVHVRNFRTERSIKSESLRNPSLVSRIKDSIALAPMQTEKVKPESRELGTIGITKATLESLTPEQQQSIKIAFAEGYLAADNKKTPGRTMKWLKVTQQLLTIFLFLGVIISLMASLSGSMFRIQLGNQSEVDPEDIHVTFDDVKGADEAKQELKDVVEFLKNPERFQTLGGKLPKGVLLVGPPGTGKTLLARAVAGEAGVPFFHAAGPEFDEILVGQGARRVRDLFKAAKDRAPCVIFIDEIDSVGAKRTTSVLHPYANQTINQLLSEMDGFHQNEGVIVLGATNRRDDLDKALLRPGRFDVEVQVPTPDYTGRKEILDHYLSKVKVSKEVDVELLARGTTGFTGADLENMVNQAALRAAMDGADSVMMKFLEIARDKVLMGPERKSRIPDEEANLITAYHEGGHAIVAYYTKESHPLHKVTIIPRGPSLGHTAYIPEKERYHVTKSQLLAMMDTMMGGRAAEELVFGPDKITSGASNDLKQATSLATHMVKQWGMSEKAGLRTIEENASSLVSVNDLSSTTVEMIDSEIKKILQDSYERAKAILKSHQKEHHLLAEALMRYETLDAEDVKAIMSGKEKEK
ncbi:ATP-dependent zinc metalloprotease YME1L [Neocloeon triangulifer]|uniref:ATP-dependent zinc metalloprotease YME1L n=1 Tax=Neocloeon triangulifer TaxID=2078957 RepID=UPI00286F4C52|nr:ATP-dependent zinc metalloprotease YME1L [Neocloeon triangulifer]